MGKIITWNVYSLPEMLPKTPESLAAWVPDVAVVIDVLRATSTVTTALAAGAKRVIPVAEPADALRLKSRLLRENSENAEIFVTGGERGGMKIDGFDFGNSPTSYTPETVGGKTLLFSTTNGTRALLALKEAEIAARFAGLGKNHAAGILENHQKPKKTAILLASFLNAEAVAHRLNRSGVESVTILCAGTDGYFTEEDILLAGLLTDRFCAEIEAENRAAERFGDDRARVALNVQAETARQLWRELCDFLPPNIPLKTGLVNALKTSRGGRNLAEIGLSTDIPDVCQIDTIDLVPEFSDGEIRAATPF